MAEPRGMSPDEAVRLLRAPGATLTEPECERIAITLQALSVMLAKLQQPSLQLDAGADRACADLPVDGVVAALSEHARRRLIDACDLVVLADASGSERNGRKAMRELLTLARDAVRGRL